MSTALEVAARLFPPPDPVNFARREAVGHLVSSDRALHNALDLRESTNEIVFPDLARLWIHPSRCEVLLALELAELKTAVQHLAEALDLLSGARLENNLRFHEELAREREERRARR